MSEGRGEQEEPQSTCAGLGCLTPPHPTLMELRVPTTRRGGYSEASGGRRPLEQRVPEDPSDLYILQCREFGFSFKLSAVSPSYHLKQRQVELLHFLLKFTRKLAHHSRGSGDKVGLFFPHPCHGWWACGLTTPRISATAVTFKCISVRRQNVPVWL